MQQQLIVSAIQMACGPDSRENIATAERLVRQAAAQGARLVLLPELFETPYFCKDMVPAHLGLATAAKDSRALSHFRAIAAELSVMLPISFFEQAGQVRFNSLAMLDTDGNLLTIYRKAHIPDGPGYCEKYYFSPGDTGFQAVRGKLATVGAAICWDQWFPEAARVMALDGAELLCYPTAIGSEPQAPDLDSSGHWQRVMQGHAAANIMPLIAANRFGEEVGETATVTFYGSSFIADQTGAILTAAERTGEAVLLAEFDLTAIAAQRREWGVFRDRRPELYGRLTQL